MKSLIFIATFISTQLLCFGALSTSTSYFLNVEALTNLTARSSVNGLSGVLTNGLTSGPGTFTGTVELRNGTTPMTNLIYNTWSDASNYERGVMSWAGNILSIGSDKLGSGSSRRVQFIQGGTNIFYIDSANGSLLWSTDNSRDIGASGLNRPKNIYVANQVNVGAASQMAGTFITSTRISMSSFGEWRSPSDGVITAFNNAGTDFNRIQFGGTTASFPALKRSTTNILVRLADDSANTGLEANILKSRLDATSAAAPTIASATTIAPTNSIVFVSGTTAIDTITAPAPISATGGQITLIPTGIFTTTTSGNIALASTAVVSKALIMVYDSVTTKWYPSY